MEKMQFEGINWVYCNQASDIEWCIESIKNKNILAVDTEVRALYKLYKEKANALDPHTSEIRLIQINWLDNTVPIIIDVLKIGKSNVLPFVKELALDNKLKIFHRAVYDLKQFKSTFGIWLKNVHCTQVIMQTLGISTGFKASQMRGHSLASLARDYFDEDLDKTQATSDWGVDNLNLEQLKYSALDVGGQKVDSIVLRGYLLIKEALINEYKEEIAFDIDQKAMYVCSKIEYAGMYIDANWLEEVKKDAAYRMSKSRMELCISLGFNHLEQKVEFVSGKWIEEVIIPEKISKLLNNNKDLVKYINQALVKSGKILTSLQAGILEETLKELEEERSIEDVIKKEVNDLDFGIDIIRHLLNYKKYVKLLSECNKYLGVINPVTRRVHANFNAIGASTGRMSSSGDLNLQQCSSFSSEIHLNQNLFL